LPGTSSSSKVDRNRGHQRLPQSRDDCVCGRSCTTEWTCPRFLLEDEPVGRDFTLVLMVKDVALALECAEGAAVVIRMG
jgi:hypothetical protein